MKSLRLLNLVILALTISMASCTGEDGTNGLDGSDGTNGINGTNGENGADGANGENGADGADGENGVGFDETTKYGAVEMTITGTRPDNQPYTDTASFKFLTTGDAGELGFQIYQSNSISIDENTDNLIISIARYSDSPSVAGSPSVLWEMSISNWEGDDPIIEDATLTIDGYTVIGDDNTYFQLQDGSFIGTQIEISGFTFDTTTNNLTFSYTAEKLTQLVPVVETLNVSGTVDVIIFEDLGE